MSILLLCRMKNKTNQVFEFCKNVQNNDFMAFFVKNRKCYDTIIMDNIEEYDLLQILLIKNHYNSKFYADSNAKKRFRFQPLHFEI